MRIIERRHVTLRLVEHQVDLLLAAHRFVVETNLVGGLHLRAEFGHDLAVHRHHAGQNEIVGLAPRADARLGDETVQTHLARLCRRFVFRIGDRFVGSLAGVLLRRTALGVLSTEAAAFDSLAVVEFPGASVTIAGFRPLRSVGALRAVALFAAGTVPLEARFVAERAARTLLVIAVIVVAERAARAVVVVEAGVLAIAGFFAMGPLQTLLSVAIFTVAERTARALLVLLAEAVETRPVVGRKVRIVRCPVSGTEGLGRLLRIGSVTLQTRATLDTLRRSDHGAFALVACEAFEHRRRVVFRIFHIPIFSIR